MHQDGPSVSVRTGGRAVAYYRDILTLASHTTAGKDEPTRPSDERLLPAHHDAVVLALGGGQHRYAQVFVTCFCNHHDLLSQWRGYGRSGGFALGFDSAALASTAQEIGGRLERVLYGAEAVAPLIAEMEGLPPTGHPGASGYAYAQREVLPWLARVKNSAFKEENEWRVTVDRATDLFFRSGGNLGVVPYVCIGFAEEALRQVVISPGPHPKLRRLGAEKLLQASGYKHVEVAESAIADSYRS